MIVIISGLVSLVFGSGEWPWRIRRKEMEMLSDQKRGWQGRLRGSVSSKGNGGVACRTKVSARLAPCSGTPRQDDREAWIDALGAPADHSQFQRDWRRRCETDEDRRAYLLLIGPERLQAIFRVEMEPDILGQVLTVICREFQSQMQPLSPSSSTDSCSQNGQPQTDSAECSGERGPGKATPVECARECTAWLSALTHTARFRINISFLEGNEQCAVGDLFNHLRAIFDCHSPDEIPTVNHLQKAYAV